ncbi:MAG: hypothetical protein HND50_08710 [Calditrichaeota bacterium]|nr:hypothetical protein [Calditrichota bacterium]
MKIKSLIITLIFTLSISYAGESQFGLVNQSLGNIKVPYSASGLARSYEIANSDSVQLNFRNYSTWTNISQTTVTFSLGYNQYWGENRIGTSFIDNANFDGVFLAIPIQQKKLIFGAGVIPFTSIEQRLSTEGSQLGENFTEKVYIHGGASKANFNLVYKVFETLSVGLGYEYTFGKISEDVRFNIDDDLETVVDFNSEKKISGNGVILSAFATPLPNLNLGIMFRPSVSGELIKSAESQSEIFNSDETLDLTLPSELNFGLEYAFNETYSVGADLVWQDWKNGYEIEGSKVGQHDTYYHLGFGVERKGSKRKFVKYGTQIDFRLGGFYNQLSTLNNAETVNEIGFSAGLSLPIQRFSSKIDLAGYIARRGKLSKNFLEETIVGFTFSVSANELWFVNLED